MYAQFQHNTNPGTLADELGEEAEHGDEEGKGHGAGTRGKKMKMLTKTTIAHGQSSLFSWQCLHNSTFEVICACHGRLDCRNICIVKIKI